jgi:hypothetical protein
MSNRPIFFCFLPLIALLVSVATPFILAATKAKGGLLQGIRTDNITTTGKIISVGPSTVGSSPSVILYSYDALGYPRNGNPGSFMREQVAESGDLTSYRPGMTIPVEYSRAMPGASRIKGFGSGSVYLSDWLQSIKYLAPVFLLPFIGILLAALRGRKKV